MVVNTYSLSNLEKQKEELDATPEATKLTETACPEVCMSEVRHKATSLMRANQSPGAYLSPARLCLRGESGNSLNGEMACVESPPFWGSDYAPWSNDGMLLAGVPEVAFVMLVPGQNCPAHYHPVGVGFGTADCLGKHGL